MYFIQYSQLQETIDRYCEHSVLNIHQVNYIYYLIAYAANPILTNKETLSAWGKKIK